MTSRESPPSGLSPFVSDPDFVLYVGDVRDVLASLEREWFDCCVTSPPYWGLRDYGADGQLGLEPTPDDYVAALVEVFREVRRVLKPEGTLWLNLGDSYVAGSGGQVQGESGQMADRSVVKARGSNVPQTKNPNVSYPTGAAHRSTVYGLAPKNLVGIPWRVAFALQADGWYLRSDIIWSKPNPMPESVTDRPTKAHEYVFLLSKGPRYFFDQEAVREPLALANAQRTTAHYDTTERGPRDGGNSGLDALAARMRNGDHFGRNVRSVWEIATQPTPAAHFATFPEELPRRCIAAGCPEGGRVLDPFMGYGTTALVARKLNRHSVGVEINPAYAKLCAERLSQQSLFAGSAA